MSDLLELARLAVLVNGDALRQARLIRSAERRRNCFAAARAAVRDQPGRVYFAECGDFIKIGFTLSVEKRIASLSTGNPMPISLLLVIKAGREFEQGLHRKFAAIRSRGEWFRKHPDLLTLIDNLRTSA